MVCVLIVTRTTVVFHVRGNTMHPEVGFFFPLFFPRQLPPCRALLRRALLVLVVIHWSIIAAIKAAIWAV